MSDETTDGKRAAALGTVGPRLEVLGAAALFSTGGAAIKAIAFAGWQVACLRSAVAALAFLALVPAARRRPDARTLRVACAYAATMILFVLANKLTTSASTIFLQATAPLYVLLLGPWLLGERIRRSDLVYMAVLAGGLAMLFAGHDAASATAPNPVLGGVLAALSGLFWALAVMGLRALGRHEDDRGAAAASSLWGNVIASVVSLPLALPLPQSRPTDWLLVVYLGAVQITLAYRLLIRGLERVAAFEASLLLLLEPVLNPIWSWLVHGERPGAWSLGGGAAILLATVVKSVWDVRRAGREAGPAAALPSD